MKVLLLEDDLELCKNIKISLEKENYMVDCCNDGETAMLYALNTDYAYDLAKEFNQYYHETRILQEEDVLVKNFRLVLIQTLADVLTKAMGLLGIVLPERM